MHSDYQSVKEQSGIFAGDGGYTIDIAGHSHLEGGLVTSTRQAESQGLNRFKTGTLSYGDIANHANYRGSAMSMDGQITLAGQGGPKKIGNQQLLDVAKYAGESQRALGVGQTRDSQQSTTRSGINTANLEITDMARRQMQLNYQTAPAIQMNSGITVGNPHPVKRDNPVSLQAHWAGIKTDTDTQTVAQQAQALTNRFDKDKVQRELDFQVNTTKQFGQTLAEAKRQTKAHLLTNASEQTKQYVDWAFDTLGAGLTTGSVQAAGVAAVSPFANRTIKQLTTDRQTGETNLVTNTLAHAALGALEAKVTGNNAAAGAMAGASSELAAPLIAKALYGTDDPKQLTEVQKQNIVNLSSLAGAIGAGIANGNGSGTEVLTSANQGAEIGKRAVENNYVMAIARASALVCSRACIQAIEAGLGISLGVALTADEEKAAFLAGMSQDPEKISRLSKEQVDYLNRQILSKGLLFDNSSILGSHVWIPNADGGFTPIDPSLVTTTYGGKQAVDPRIFVNHTGGVEYPADYNLPTHTGGNQTVTNDKDSHILVGGESQVGDWRDGVVTRDNRLPIPEPIKANNGLIIESNPKHTLGGTGNRPNAGIEPKDSLKLFESSVEGGKKRYAIDSEGRIHQFNSNKEGDRWHWAGRTGKDQRVEQQINPSDINKDVYERLGTHYNEVRKK